MFIIRYRCQIIPIPNINVNIDLQANTMRYLYPMYMNYTLENTLDQMLSCLSVYH